MKNYRFRVEQNYVIQKTISSVLKVALEPVPIEEQIERILDLVLGVPGLSPEPVGAIYLVGEEPEVLVLKASRTLPGSRHVFCEKVPFGKCLCGRAAAARTMVFADHVDNRHEIRCPEEFSHGHYCQPVVSGEEVLGLINLVVEEGHRRTKEEEEFLSAVADALAGIIGRHRSETDKRRILEQCAESEKLAALGRLTASVAHEIRNPLTAIGGFARRLDKRFEEGTAEKEYTGVIIFEVARLENILRNVLTFSGVAKPRVRKCDVRDISERALRTFEEICSEQSITIKRSYQELPQIDADGELLLEAVENLISNAIDAMPGGGTLTVAAGMKAAKERSYVTVKVGDTGRGIEPEDQKYIFEPFFTRKAGARGAGLGLSITKKIAEEHGGFVKVQSAPGAGSTFSLYLLAPES
ncbi:MAG: ATP-binding protein [Nitrospirota bacterium]